jgi:hypothetical protein
MLGRRTFRRLLGGAADVPRPGERQSGARAVRRHAAAAGGDILVGSSWFVSREESRHRPRVAIDHAPAHPPGCTACCA